jgi:hypothetical protein
MTPLEYYIVKFWTKNAQTGLLEQKQESVFFRSKGKHKAAEQQVTEKYRKLGQRITTISVTYQ